MELCSCCEANSSTLGSGNSSNLIVNVADIQRCSAGGVL